MARGLIGSRKNTPRQRATQTVEKTSDGGQKRRRRREASEGEAAAKNGWRLWKDGGRKVRSAHPLRTIPRFPPAVRAGTLLPLPGRHLLGDFPRHLREGANETLGVGIDPRRRPGDARSKTPGLPGARERHRSSR